MKRDQQFASIRRTYGTEKEAPSVLAIESSWSPNSPPGQPAGA